MEATFVLTREQAERLAQRREAISFTMKRERFVSLGLGLGLADQREAAINLDGRERLWRLVGVEYAPSDPDVINTAWVPAPPKVGFGQG